MIEAPRWDGQAEYHAIELAKALGDSPEELRLLNALSEHDSPLVRRAVAANPNIGPRTLQKIQEWAVDLRDTSRRQSWLYDAEQRILRTVAEHHASGPGTLRAIAESGHDRDLQLLAVRHPRLGTAQLRLIAGNAGNPKWLRQAASREMTRKRLGLRVLG